MLIVKISAESNGAHDNQMTSTQITPPDGYIVIPPALEATILPLLPWIKLTIENGTVTAVEDDAEAREAWENRPAPDPTLEEQIATLKQKLAATDYKIIKCSEYQLAGKNMPYDIATLHTERQAIRDKINKLESF